MPTDTRPDLGRLLQLLRRPKVTASELIRFYVGYDGHLQFGLQKRWFDRLVETLGEAGAGLRIRDAIGSAGELRRPILAEHAPDLLDAYPEPGGLPVATELLPAGPNELYRPGLPQPIFRKSTLPERPAYRLLRQDGARLLVTPALHVALLGEAFIPALSSRALARPFPAAESRRIERPLVLIRDRFPDGNFAHVLFDWLPRFVHLAAAEPAIAREAVFVLGGRAEGLQAVLAGLLHDACGIAPERWLYPDRPLLIEAAGGLYGFSDQADPVHPMNLAHPTTLGLVREVLARLPIEASATRRIYVTRRDANSRRVENEAALAGLLLKRGFATVALGELSLADQFAVVGGAEALVGPHGMGFTHLLLHRGQPRVLELFNPDRGTDAYALIARGLGFHHDFLLGERVSEASEDFRVDPTAFEKRLP